MKKIHLFFAFIIVLAMSTAGFSQIAGTAHDFSGSSWNTNGEICLPCHTPHNSLGWTNGPLWNHQLSGVAYYSVYPSGGTMQSTPGQPDGSSKLCLSCHDGTVALENYSGTTTGTYHISLTNNVGVNLSNDHPISMTYDAALSVADGGLFDPSTSSSGLGSTIDADMLSAGKVQCSSCHDVHGTPYISLLVKDNAGSALCLTCHNT
ncbi:MAG: cytochrome c3 family protein [Bacteroidota bacterium]